MSARPPLVVVALVVALCVGGCGPDPYRSQGSRSDYEDEYAVLDALAVDQADVVVDPFHRDGYVSLYLTPQEGFDPAQDLGLPAGFSEDDGALTTRYSGRSPQRNVTCSVTIEPDEGDARQVLRIICSDPPA